MVFPSKANLIFYMLKDYFKTYTITVTYKNQTQKYVLNNFKVCTEIRISV